MLLQGTSGRAEVPVQDSIPDLSHGPGVVRLPFPAERLNRSDRRLPQGYEGRLGDILGFRDPDITAATKVEDVAKVAELDWRGRDEGSTAIQAIAAEVRKRTGPERYGAAEKFVSTVIHGGWHDSAGGRILVRDPAAAAEAPTLEDIGDNVWAVTGLAKAAGVDVTRALRDYAWGDAPLSPHIASLTVGEVDDLVGKAGLVPHESPFQALHHNRLPTNIAALEANLLASSVQHPELTAVLCEGFERRVDGGTPPEALDKFRHEKVGPVVAHEIFQAAYYTKSVLRRSLSQAMAASVGRRQLDSLAAAREYAAQPLQ